MSASNGGEDRQKPTIGITLGDINGIGPEVAVKATWDPRLRDRCRLVFLGSAHALGEHADRLDLEDHGLEVVTAEDALSSAADCILDLAPGRRPGVEWGRETEIAGQLSMQAVEKAVELCLSGHIDAMVTAPISKKSVSMAGYTFRGHTEFIAERSHAPEYTMVLVSGRLRVGLVTTHEPLRAVPELVEIGRIREKLDVIHRSLKRDFAISHPKIAVLGLNPHAGDGGVIGTEEEEIIRPAVLAEKENGRLVFGPFPADGFFGGGLHLKYDAVLAMYHDQGLGPFKALAFGSGVNFTAGLPLVRTSPDHGTAFDIAGRGVADPASMREAVYVAMDIVRRRAGADLSGNANKAPTGG